MVNQTFSNMFGVTPQSMVGKHFDDYHCFSVDTCERCKQMDQEVLNNRQKIIIPEQEVLFKDGSKHWFQLTKAPIDYQGDMNCVLSIGVDVTARKKAESSLEQSERRLRLMFKNSHDLMALYNAEGSLVWANTAWHKVLGSLLAKQTDPFALVHPDEQALVYSYWQDMELEARIFTNIQYRQKTASGDYIYLETTIRKLDLEGEEMTFFSSRDITDRKELEEDLQNKIASLETMQNLNKKRYEKLIEQEMEILNLRSALKKANLK